ncbi:MAG: RsbRD N-terminal domain-containing protein [Terriglobales bacterium]
MQHTDVIVEEWFRRTLESYPSGTAQLMDAEKDPFRNPVGHTLRENLSVLAQQVLRGLDFDQAMAALDAIVRIRAVQDFTASQAVGFVFALRDILRAHGQHDPVLDGRIDRLALMAFDAYMQCCEQIAIIRANESSRAVLGLRKRAAAAGFFGT